MRNKLLMKTALCAALLTGCSNPPSSAVSEKITSYSNTSLNAGFDTVLFYREMGYDQGPMEENFNALCSLFTRYNSLFDIYNDYDGINNIKTINDNAGIEPVKVDQEILDLLHLAKDFYDWSGGEFDVTMGAILKIWHEYRTEGIALNEKGEYGAVPSDEELEAVSGCRGWDKIEIDDEAGTVYITDPCVSLDVGGAAKGFATELAAKKLEANADIMTAAINMGGNNRTINSKPDGTTWNVRIQHPDGGDRLVLVSHYGSISFVTSGDYERFYYAEDRNRYHHIIDPHTLKPADLYRSVTIITPDSGAADCLSTALFTLSVEEGKELLAKYTEATGNEADAIWILDKSKPHDGLEGKEYQDYFLTWTEGLNESLTWE